MSENKKTAIIYDDLVDIRFSDLDHYNHVNSKHYIDLVSTARLTYLKRELKTPIETITERGYGFFMTKSTTNYKRPIQGLQRVRARTHVSEVVNNRTLIIPFELSNEDGSRTFADGTLEFTIIDMKTLRSTDCPDWMTDLFFK